MYVASFWSRYVFLRWITADPYPWGNFTDENRSNVERPWGILSPSKTHFRLPVNFKELHSTKDNRSHVCGILLKQLVFLMVNHHGHLPFRELHSTDDNRSSVERPWGILSLFMTWFQLQVKSPFQRLWHRHICMWHLCEAGHISYGESPRTPPL